jgi:hypothetical protein
VFDGSALLPFLLIAEKLLLFEIPEIDESSSNFFLSKLFEGTDNSVLKSEINWLFFLLADYAKFGDGSLFRLVLERLEWFSRGPLNENSDPPSSLLLPPIRLSEDFLSGGLGVSFVSFSLKDFILGGGVVTPSFFSAAVISSLSFGFFCSLNYSRNCLVVILELVRLITSSLLS